MSHRGIHGTNPLSGKNSHLRFPSSEKGGRSRLGVGLSRGQEQGSGSDRHLPAGHLAGLQASQDLTVESPRPPVRATNPRPRTGREPGSLCFQPAAPPLPGPSVPCSAQDRPSTKVPSSQHNRQNTHGPPSPGVSVGPGLACLPSALQPPPAAPPPLAQVCSRVPQAQAGDAPVTT